MIDHYEIVIRLIGKIKPIGKTNIDNERFENLKAMCDLVDKLLTDISAVVPYKERQEFSMKRAGEYANNFFTNLVIIE
ncbi:MAG: hypothetical protein PHS93_10120 [Candidatus Omnitrophica bacterium]|nr:hypothetical protein [Candidatus Omnitrophota bacterium]